MASSTKKEKAEEVFRFLLFGKTGSGKSTTGNTIFGQEKFDNDVSFDSVTLACSREMVRRDGLKIEIMDSPGIYDTKKDHDEICGLLMQAIACMHPGPDVIFFVLQIGRYTEEEHGAYMRLKSLLDNDLCKYLIILFTHGDALKKKKKTIEDVLNSTAKDSKLRLVLSDCDNRYVVIDNTTTDRGQVTALLDVVRALKRKNKGKPYTCPEYAKLGELVDEEINKRMKAVEEKELAGKQTVKDLKNTLQSTSKAVKTLQTDLQAKAKEMQTMKELEDKRDQELDKLKDQIANLKDEQIKALQTQYMTQYPQERITEIHYHCHHAGNSSDCVIL